MTYDVSGDLAGIVDSHFHLTEMAAWGMDVRSLLAALFAQGFRGGLDFGGKGDDFENRTALTADFPAVGIAVGLPPSAAAGPWRDELPRLADLCRHPRVAALGEAGIDLYRLPGSGREQTELFQAQIRIAGTAGLPVVIHCRDAEEEVLEALRRSPPGSGGIMHCFSGDYEAGKNFLDLGLHRSFAGNLTYPKNRSLREGAARYPSDRILVETDSPYLAPQPLRGRPNHPGNAAVTLGFLARLRGTSPEELALRTAENFSRLFPLIPLAGGGS